MKNNFTEETRSLFFFETSCWNKNCEVRNIKTNIERLGSNRDLELHHILGRVSNSPLNAMVVCRKCHDIFHNKCHPTDKEKSEQLIYTLKWLLKNNYDLKEEDIQFYHKYKKYYKNERTADTKTDN